MVTITKSLAERFVIRSDDPHWWANITITSDGFLDIQSDYGSYSYRWSSFGDDFKKFLAGCDDDYLIRKFGKNRTSFDENATVKNIKQDIIAARKNKELSQEDARSMYNDVDTLADYPSQDLFMVYLMDSKISLYASDPASIPIVLEDDWAACEFLKKVWPHFIREIDPVVTVHS